MTLKDQIWEAHPYMPRVKKLLLTRHLHESYERVQVVCKYLDLPPPNLYDPPNCNITDEFLIIRDKDNELVAKAYIGSDQAKLGLVIVPNGSKISEHKFHLIQGRLPNTYGYIDSCRCSDCQHALILQQEEVNNERTERYFNNADKIRNVSERVPPTVDAPRNVPPKLTIMKITSPTNDESNRNRPTV